jgi:hypothetical protein
MRAVASCRELKWPPFKSAANITYKTNTKACGDFTVRSLPVGDYRVRSEASGFKTK